MGTEDFINLDASKDSDPKDENNDASKDSDPKDENNGSHNANSTPSEAQYNTSEINDDGPNGNNIQTPEGNDVDEEVKHMETKDLEVNMPLTQDELRENVQLVESVMVAEMVNEVEVDQEMDDGGTVNLPECTISNLVVDVSSTSGVKRARMEYIDQEPSVRVVYNFLTRESKRKLMELMQHWSEWHAKCQPPKELSTEDMESGEETYFPALHVGSKNSSTVSFWVGSQTSKGDMEYKLNSDSVPLYDRGCTLGLSLTDDSANYERIGALEASRCFNCSSYSHSLRECPKPRDNAAIVNARKQHSSKRNQTPGSRTAVRYYEKPSGKYDDLRAGILGPETRESLGIGEHDPPPWLHRMREMGYPPGYLDDVEDDDQPSGITIFDGEEKIEPEEGELAEEVKPEPSAKKMTVDFPGINAPIPENGDTRLWAHAPIQRPSRQLEPQRNPYHDQRRSAEHRDDGPPPPPGTEYGHAGYSPRYSPYDHHSAISRSPVLGRSFSDRGRRNLPYESSPGTPQSPYPYPGQHWQSPQLHSPTPEHRSHERHFNSSPDVSRERHEHEPRRRHRR